jgi:molybdopterin-guanine dinucleotide biosynthesis protein A
VLACDLPFVTAELLGFMLERAEDVDAVVPMDQNGILQPLCALYSTRCLLPTVELINSGVSAPRRLCGKVTTRVLAFAEIAHLDYAQWFFLDIDSPLDYQQALTLVQNKSRIRT